MQKSLNDITSEDLLLIEELASYFFTPREVAVMVEADPNHFIAALEDEQCSIYQAFQKGRLQSEMELRKSIIKLARAGSSPAQTMSLDLLNKSKIKILDR
jgi:hypothetical protein